MRSIRLVEQGHWIWQIKNDRLYGAFAGQGTENSIFRTTYLTGFQAGWKGRGLVGGEVGVGRA